MTDFKNKVVGTRTLLAISAAFGIVASLWIAQHFDGDEAITAVGGISVSILVMLIGELHNQDRLVEAISDWKSEFTLNKRVFRLFPLIHEKADYERFLRLAHQHGQLHEAVANGDPVRDLITWKENQLYSRLETGLRQMVDGCIEIDDEAKELTSNGELLNLARTSVDAVSYQEGKFWEEEVGINFLNAHKSAIARGVVVTRIFIVQGQDPSSLKKILTEQCALGIHVYTVNEVNLPARFKEDFVVYDSRMVRTAKLISLPAAYAPKHAELLTRQSEVASFVEKFKALKLLSREAEA